MHRHDSHTEVLRPMPPRKPHRRRLRIALFTLLFLAAVGGVGYAMWSHLIPVPAMPLVQSDDDDDGPPPDNSVRLVPAGPATPAQSADIVAIPEIARLGKVFAGDWSTVETMQNGKPVPDGQGRTGNFRVWVASGGTALVSEGRSSGTIGGDLSWFITVWWEPEAKHYRLLTCFRLPPDVGCELRGTARWDRSTFVNDYDEMANGRRIKMRDVWTDITPTSHTLTELHDRGDGVMTPYVVSHNTRRSP